MMRTIKYSIICLWLLMAASLHAQQFKNTYHPAGLSGESPAYINSSYSNPLLSPRRVQPVSAPARRDSYTPPTQVYKGTMTVKKDYKTSKSGGGGMSGSGMGGGGLAGSGVNTTRTENIRTIVTISSYQNIGGINTGGGSLLGAGPTPPPPPPTPDPGTDDPSHQLPVGDAIWFMLVLAGGYVGWKRHRQFQGL